MASLLPTDPPSGAQRALLRGFAPNDMSRKREVPPSGRHAFLRAAHGNATAPANMIAAVSPEARLKLKMMPVRMPGPAAGRVTVKKERNFPAPSPMAASR